MFIAAGFLVTFLFGGLAGVILASQALDFHVTETYFVVGHFHYVLFGTIVFAMFSGIYFWGLKMTGRFFDEGLSKSHFWTTFVGFHLTFLIQHWLGNMGMPRRYPDYLPTDGFTTLNTISTIGSFVLGASLLPFVWNVFRSLRYGEITRPMTRGATGTPWNGRPAARRPGTTSPHCPGSAPNDPPSNSATRTCQPGSAPRRTRTGIGRHCRRWNAATPRAST